jgi:hypothetical protein
MVVQGQTLQVTEHYDTLQNTLGVKKYKFAYDMTNCSVFCDHSSWIAEQSNSPYNKSRKHSAQNCKATFRLSMLEDTPRCIRKAALCEMKQEITPFPPAMQLCTK